jgi:hypothetical protein
MLKIEWSKTLGGGPGQVRRFAGTLEGWQGRRFARYAYTGPADILRIRNERHGQRMVVASLASSSCTIGAAL